MTDTGRKREACFLIGKGGAVLWGDVAAGPLAMPDSRARWEAIWRHRRDLEEIAHSHPIGPLVFSSEDESTMDALDRALGRSLRYSVVAPNGMIARDERLWVSRVETEPWWAELLRLISGMERE